MNRISVEDQIEQLSDLGISLNDEFDLNVVLEDFDRDELETHPYDYLIVSLAGNGYSDQIAEFRMSALEPQAYSYADIFLSLDSMIGGELGISEVSDNFDDLYSSDGLREAWVEFKCRGESMHFDFLYDFEYLDLNLFYRFNELLEKHKINCQVYHLPQDESGIFIILQDGYFSKLKKLMNEFDLEKIAYRKGPPWTVDEFDADSQKAGQSGAKILVAITVILLLAYLFFW